MLVSGMAPMTMPRACLQTPDVSDVRSHIG
jgi:hypothetical protein